MSQQHSQQPPQGPPYPPQGALPGGAPTVTEDVAPMSVFLVIYLAFAVFNLALFNINWRKKHHFFLPQALLGGFCMARVLTCTLRITWAMPAHKDNVSLAIAAQIFVNAGILIVYIINVLFAQRILRSRHPSLGWHRGLKAFFIAVYSLIGVALVLVIVLTVMMFYTLNLSVISEAHWIQRGAILYLLIVAFMPLPILAVALLLPRKSEPEPFGRGSPRSRLIILVLGASFCTTIAGFKAGVLWSPARPATDPAWYDSKACFFVFNFTFEICILILYTASGFQHRFHVPDGSSKRQTYLTDDGDSSSVDEAEDAEKRKDSGVSP